MQAKDESEYQSVTMCEPHHTSMIAATTDGAVDNNVKGWVKS